MKRRRFLQGLAAGTVVVAGGTVWRSVDQGVFLAGTGPAYEPWDNWRNEANSGPMALVRAAILASNPHNTQPWMFRVHGDAVELYAERSRNLGSFDPYLREMHLGLGCAVENMMRAARAHGYVPELDLTGGKLEPIEAQSGRILVARIDLHAASAGSMEDPLYEAIPNRHTNRGPYERGRDLPSDLEQQFAALIAGDEDVEIALYSNAGQIEMWRRIIVEATEAIIADETMVDDSERWFRHSWDAIQTHRDGPTLDAAGLSPMMTRIAKFLPRPSAQSNHQYWLDATRDVQVATAPAFGVILVPELYDRARSLQAGRVWQRVHLWATTQGLAMQPLNQPVERVDRERQLSEPPSAARALAALIGERNAKPTFAFRIGYPVRQAPVSPRRSLQQVLLS